METAQFDVAAAKCSPSSYTLSLSFSLSLSVRNFWCMHFGGNVVRWFGRNFSIASVYKERSWVNNTFYLFRLVCNNQQQQTKRILQQTTHKSSNKVPIKMWTSELNILIGEFYVFITCHKRLEFVAPLSIDSISLLYKIVRFWFGNKVNFISGYWQSHWYHYFCFILLFVISVTNFHMDDDIWLSVTVHCVNIILNTALVSSVHRCSVFIVFDAEIY